MREPSPRSRRFASESSNVWHWLHLKQSRCHLLSAIYLLADCTITLLIMVSVCWESPAAANLIVSVATMLESGSNWRAVARLQGAIRLYSSHNRLLRGSSQHFRLSHAISYDSGARVNSHSSKALPSSSIYSICMSVAIQLHHDSLHGSAHLSTPLTCVCDIFSLHWRLWILIWSRCFHCRGHFKALVSEAPPLPIM